MTKIKNQDVYKPDLKVHELDYLVGSDFDQNNKTVSFRVKELADFVGRYNGESVFNFTYYNNPDLNGTTIPDGYFFTKDNQTNPSLTTEIFCSKVSSNGYDMSDIFEMIIANPKFDFKLFNPNNPNEIIYYTINAVVDETSWFKLTVTYKYAPTSTIFIDNTTYSFYILERPEGSNFTGDYNDLQNIPTEFNPSTHTHPISQVTNLQSALDSKENITNKVDVILGDSSIEYPSEKAVVDYVNSKVGIGFANIVYFNDNDPQFASVFDTNNPPITNNPALINDVNNLYVGLNSSTWVYKTSPNGYFTYSSTSTSSNFFITGTNNDAGGVKTGSITKTGELVIDSLVNNDSGLKLLKLPSKVLKTDTNGKIVGTTNIQDISYAPLSDKQNSLTIDGTGTKYPTVDAINAKNDLLTENSAGAISGFTLTNNGDGTISISSGYALVRATNDENGILQKYLIPAVTNLALTDNVNNYVIVQYNSGNPNIAVVTDPNVITTTNNTLIYVIARYGTTINYLYTGEQNIDSNGKLRRRFLNIEPIKRAAGAVIGFTNRTINTTAGLFYGGLTPYTTPVLGATFTNVYNNGSTWTRQTAQTQVNNTQYNLNGVLTNMTNGRFRTDFVYIMVNNPSVLYTVMGTSQATSLANARLVTMPSALPVELQRLGVLVGRLIIGTNNATITEVSSSYDITFNASTVINHNDTGNIQGGDIGDYQHVTTAEKNTWNNLDSNTVKLTGNQTIDGNKSFLKNVAVNRTLTGLNFHAYDDLSTLNINSEDLISGYCSYDSYINIQNTANINHANGYQSRLRYNGSGNIINTTGYNFQFSHNGTGIVSNLFGINIQAPTGTGTILNKYGILINDFTGGYSIYSAGGENYFAGKIKHAVGTVNEDSALIADITTGTRNASFLSLSAKNLTNQKIPYHVSNISGFVDSPIATDGSEVFIGGQTSQLKGYDVEIIKSGTQLLLSDTVSDLTNKNGRIAGASYNNANNPFGLIYWTATNSANTINFGGGSGILNSATKYNFFTANTVGTNTGTNTFEIANTLITSNVPISGQTPTANTHLTTKLYVDSGLATKQNALTDPVTGTGANGRVAFWNGANSQTSDSLLFWDNTNKRLGIGVASPLYTLDVRETNGGTFFDGSNTTYNRIKSFGSSESNGKDLLISAQNSTTTPDIYLKNSGNLLIGKFTDDGINKLQVNGSVSATSFNGNATSATSLGVIPSSDLNITSITEGIISYRNTATITNAPSAVAGLTLEVRRQKDSFSSLGTYQLFSANSTTDNSLYFRKINNFSTVEQWSSWVKLLDTSSQLTGFTSGAGTVSATDTYLQAINKLDGNINAKVSNATHTGDATGSTVLTLATVNSNVGTFGTASSIPQFTVNAKGLVTFADNLTISLPQANVVGLTADLALKAPLASPSFTGTPTAPTATAGTNTTQLATTAFVANAVSSVATSGSYTPTVTLDSNVTSATVTRATYTKVGNIVTVMVNFNVSPTTQNTNTSFSVTLPISRATAFPIGLGTGTVINADIPRRVYPLAVYSDTTTKARIDFNPVAYANGFAACSATFQYSILD